MSKVKIKKILKLVVPEFFILLVAYFATEDIYYTYSHSGMIPVLPLGFAVLFSQATVLVVCLGWALFCYLEW